MSAMNNESDYRTYQEHLGHAIIGLAMMCFSTSTVHAFLASEFSNPIRKRTAQELEFFTAMTIILCIAVISIWSIGLFLWISHLSDVSTIQRNNSLICGIVANVGLLWVYLRTPRSALEIYATYTLWPAYIGLTIGMLM
jgi:hypothetical protein